MRRRDFFKLSMTALVSVLVPGLSKLFKPKPCFSGTVSGAWAYDVVLTDDEILALSKGMSPLLIRPDKLVRYTPSVNIGQDYKGITVRTHYANSPEGVALKWGLENMPQAQG